MTSDNKILARIKKLLATAKGNGSKEISNEAANAMRMAQELMRKHGLSETEVTVEADSDGGLGVNVDPADMEKTTAPQNKKVMTRWDKAIMSLMRKAFNVGAYYAEGGRGKASVTFYGLPEDVATAHAAMPLVLKSMRRATRAFLAEEREIQPDMSANGIEARSFKDGYVRGLWESLQDEAEGTTTVKQTGTGSALVVLTEDVLKAKRQALKVYERTQVGRLRTSKGRGVYRDRNSYARGQQQGRAQGLSRNTMS